MRISSGAAACSRRAAVLTASPVINVWPSAGSPATTSPVLTPVRKRMAMPRSASSSIVQTPQALADLGGRPHRAERVIFVELRDAEDRHHRIADELLDRPAVALDDRLHLGEVAAHQGAHRLWVELFAKARRARHIGEQDGHRATRSARLQRNRCGALGAELCAVGNSRSRRGTHQGHTATLRLTLGSAPHQRRPFARPVMKRAPGLRQAAGSGPQGHPPRVNRGPRSLHTVMDTGGTWGADAQTRREENMMFDDDGSFLVALFDFFLFFAWFMKVIRHG